MTKIRMAGAAWATPPGNARTPSYYGANKYAFLYSGLVTEIWNYYLANGNNKPSAYYDNGSDHPGDLLGSVDTDVAGTSGNWVASAITAAAATQGNYVWIGGNCDTSGALCSAVLGSDLLRYVSATYATWTASDPCVTLPSTFGETLGMQLWGYAKPTTSNIDGDNTITIGQTNIDIVGLHFDDDTSGPTVWITDSASWGSETVKVQQTRNSFNDATINIDYADPETDLSAGTGWHVWIETGLGQVQATGLNFEIQSAGNSCVVAGILSPLSFAATVTQQNAATVSGALSVPVADIQAAQHNSITVDAALPVLSFETALQQHNAAIVDALLPVLGFETQVSQTNAATVDATLPSLVFSVFGNNSGGNSCVVSMILPIPVADIQAAQTNSITVDAALPALTADITAEQHNLIQVQGIIDSLGFSTIVTQENLCQVDGTIQALQFATEITQENAATVEGILSPLSFSVNALVGNVAQVNMILPVFGFDATVTQKNAITVDGIIPSLIADIIITRDASDDITTTVYTRQKIMALSLIARKGQSVTWRRKSDPVTADADKPFDVTDATPVDVPVSIVFLPVDRTTQTFVQRMTGTLVPIGFLVGLMGYNDFTPSIKDVVIRGTRQLRIKNIDELSPNGEQLLYTILFEQ